MHPPRLYHPDAKHASALGPWSFTVALNTYDLTFDWCSIDLHSKPVLVLRPPGEPVASVAWLVANASLLLNAAELGDTATAFAALKDALRETMQRVQAERRTLHPKLYPGQANPAETVRSFRSNAQGALEPWSYEVQVSEYDSAVKWCALEYNGVVSIVRYGAHAIENACEMLWTAMAFAKIRRDNDELDLLDRVSDALAETANVVEQYERQRIEYWMERDRAEAFARLKGENDEA